jgi:predicted nucleotidyltransferase/HEPN domain-containing protein
MRTDLDHLPPNKRDELERIVATIFEEFRGATADAIGKRKSARILKILLYGSYARGDWVDAPFSANQFRSDFDLLIIVSQKELTDRATYWSRAEERFIREYLIEKTLSAPINFIVHSLQQVNDGLAHGRTFFIEVAREGIALYEADDRELHKPKPKAPLQRLSDATEYFEEWFPASASFYRSFEHAVADGFNKNAAFQLHQSAEQLYHALMLTLTFYTPYNHNLAFLRTQAERLDRRLFEVWPRATRKDRAMFEKLKDAYVKARYSKHYRVSSEELAWLGERVEQLGQLVQVICTAHIATLEQAAAETG